MDNEFEGFERSTNTVDASPWLLIVTTVFCSVVMLLVVPILVTLKRQRQNQQEVSEEDKSPSCQSVLAYDDEVRSIFQLVGPYTLSRVSEEVFSNCVLILVAQFLGTREVAAYALVHILLELSNGLLMGPIYACITLSSHAVGAKNHFLAGQYVQLAVGLYLGLNVPVVYLWCTQMRSTILWLRWGDEETACLAQDFLQFYIWAVLVKGMTESMTILWSILDHAFARSILEVSWDGSIVVILTLLLLFIPPEEADLQLVGFVCSVTSLVFFIIAVGTSHFSGWLVPFEEGIFRELAIVHNLPALQLLVSTAIPLAGGEAMTHAEWAVLTLFASFMGPGEVAAWAILGNIWDLFYYVGEGVGEAAEIRISLHLGDNHPALAKLSTYKSLTIGTVLAIVVSVLTFALRDVIPRWFTYDSTLQQLLRELIPFVVVANLTMMFGMNCWFVLGAQGKYGLATWITTLASWFVCVPLAAFLVMVCHFDLQGLAAALTAGFATAGTVLSYVTLITDWPAVALKISTENAEEEEEETEDVEEEEESDGEEEKTVASEKTPLLI